MFWMTGLDEWDEQASRHEPKPETEIGRLRRELEEAKQEIRALRAALGANHQLTMRGLLF